jgi:hypothetical protein
VELVYNGLRKEIQVALDREADADDEWQTQRLSALNDWREGSHPLSGAVAPLASLLHALSDSRNNMYRQLPPAPHQFTASELIKKMYDGIAKGIEKAVNIPPLSTGGRFPFMISVAIRNLQKFLVGTPVHRTRELFVQAVVDCFRNEKVNICPWPKSSTAGQAGRPHTKLSHYAWLTFHVNPNLAQ